jgi:hypothetical protein
MAKLFCCCRLPITLDGARLVWPGAAAEFYTWLYLDFQSEEEEEKKEGDATPRDHLQLRRTNQHSRSPFFLGAATAALRRRSSL